MGCTLETVTVFVSYYNIPRACLLNRSPVPAMVKTNGLGLLWFQKAINEASDVT